MKNNKLNNLILDLKKLKKVVIAYSGGVDSTFLLYVSIFLAKIDVLAVTFVSELVDEEEILFIKEFVKTYKIRHTFIKKSILSNPIFKENPINRCYYCKKEIFSHIIDLKNKKKYDYIIEGTNFDDKNEYRPGKKALKELNIISPLYDNFLTKKEIRNLSQNLNLLTYNKPSTPCYATRIPYHSEINIDKIQIVKKSEKFIKEMLNINNLRVRLYDFTMRIELEEKDIKKIFNKEKKREIIKYLKTFGIFYITVDLEGLISGSMDKEHLNKL